MNNTNDEPLRVLRFWRDLEIFNIPTTPTAKDNTPQIKVSTLRRRGPHATLPWHRDEFAPTEQHAFLHVVYVGVADVENLARLVLRGILPNDDLSEREIQRVSGQGWLAAFVVNEHGVPLPSSYLAASYAHGVDAFRETGTLENVNARLQRAQEEFAQRCHRLAPANGNDESTASPSGTPLRWDELEIEREVVCALLGEGAKKATLDWRVVVRTSRIKRSKLKDNQEAATEFLNSFYLDDLDRLIDQAEKQHPFGAALTRYLGAAITPEGRVDILTEHATMAHLVSAARLPSARWPAPSKYPLVLAQQAAVAEVLCTLSPDRGILGVNGPPGTGKTTLLCDVIAEIVTERAQRIAKLAKPAALFEESVQIAGMKFSPLKHDVIDGTSIVVTSNNNNAVKNITQELPARAKISGEFEPVAYFDEVIREIFRAQKVLDDEKQPIDGWGVIAAALGNVSNRRSFTAGFFRDERKDKQPATVAGTKTDAPEDDGNDDAEETTTNDAPQNAKPRDDRPPTMKQILEAASEDYPRYQAEWKAAKRAFLDVYAEVEKQRAVLVAAEQAARELDRSRVQQETLEASLEAIADTIAASEQALAASRTQQADLRALMQSHQAILAQCEAAYLPSLWDRLMQWFGRETPRMIVRRQALEAPTRALSETTAALSALSRDIAQSEAALQREREQHHTVSRALATLMRQRQVHQQALDAGYATGAKHFPDDAFWSLPSDTRHRASIAVSPALDHLRARLFLAAVELHRATILATAGKFIGNLRVVNRMLTNTLQDKLPADQRPLLWDVLFFVVPVVSTTLASFDRLFVGLGQDSLGWLLIDEAGQATPQSAAGAIWRSRRAVIVGDPLQVEPVFTVPLRLTEALRRRHQVDSAWSPADESVQTLTDRITPFGSWVSASADGATGDHRIWTGMPLRTHRRCDDPMFSVANRIAYAGQMVQGSVDDAGQPLPTPFSCVLGESAWFDVASTRVRHPVSEDELDVLRQCLTALRREPARGEDNKPARVYIISPFRKVANACGDVVRRGKFEGIDVGTVHTFQGKEAAIVFLVLGTAPGKKGAGARAWATGAPNLLNVAITRAKCRLYVIGDTQQWGGLDYVSELYAALPVVRRPSSTQPSTPAEDTPSLFDA
ncbi:viral (Super1) RNA helicase family protein [Burkholderia thailandensis MSMB121]|uniref:AAA domain-containing protein n=1 Tax=Burkholderia humptydooensis TaxID=430531 RepID=UPI000327FF98|nr:AAA domain-containing protein [Burkholderia humptydooensis]AGK48503.1 viral (Super1) RNA helicase family protein [Burkholderia thailandensis MSMB121]ATF37180.1 DNA helicase [Burkholderia thailandensis]KST74553.1 DNA helicase [Burkholderia humptydooensis]